MSAKLKWTDAIQMIQAYQNNSNAMKSAPPNGCEIIRGFKFDKAEIQNVINNSQTDKVLILPAVVKAELSKPKSEQTFTMIVVGLDSNDSIVTITAADYAAPVLNSTPSNYPYIPTC